MGSRWLSIITPMSKQPEPERNFNKSDLLPKISECYVNYNPETKLNNIQQFPSTMCPHNLPPSLTKSCESTHSSYPQGYPNAGSGVHQTSNLGAFSPPCARPYSHHFSQSINLCPSSYGSENSSSNHLRSPATESYKNCRSNPNLKRNAVNVAGCANHSEVCTQSPMRRPLPESCLVRSTNNQSKHPPTNSTIPYSSIRQNQLTCLSGEFSQPAAFIGLVRTESDGPSQPFREASTSQHLPHVSVTYPSPDHAGASGAVSWITSSSDFYCQQYQGKFKQNNLPAVKLKVDFGVQTESMEEFEDEYSTEGSDDSENSESEECKPSTSPRSGARPSVSHINVQSDISHPASPVSPRHVSIASTATTGVQQSPIELRLAYSGRFDNQRLDIANGHASAASVTQTWIANQMNKRESATSFDSGRDSSYAGSSESSGGTQATNAVQLTTASIEQSLHQPINKFHPTVSIPLEHFDLGNIPKPETLKILDGLKRTNIDSGLYPSSYSTRTCQFYDDHRSVSSGDSSSQGTRSEPLPSSDCAQHLSSNPSSYTNNIDYSGQPIRMMPQHHNHYRSVPSGQQQEAYTTTLQHPPERSNIGLDTINEHIGSDRYSNKSRINTTQSSQSTSGEADNSELALLCSDTDELSLLAWLDSVGLKRLSQCLMGAGFDLWTLCRSTPEELNSCGVTNPRDRQILRTELSRLHLPDMLPDHLPFLPQDWIVSLNLQGYWSSLQQHDLATYEQLAKLTWEDLEEVGIYKLGHQKKLLMAVDRLNRLLQQGVRTLTLHDAFESFELPGRDLDYSRSEQQHPVLTNGNEERTQSFSGTTKATRDNSESPPLPPPPPAFQDPLPESRMLSERTVEDCSRLLVKDKSTTVGLPPPVPMRRSSIPTSEITSSVSPTNGCIHSGYRENDQWSNGRQNRADSLVNLTQRSPSPSMFQMDLNASPSKWASGTIVQPTLRLPKQFSHNDDELNQMDDIHTMLDALNDFLISKSP